MNIENVNSTCSMDEMSLSIYEKKSVIKTYLSSKETFYKHLAEEANDLDGLKCVIYNNQVREYEPYLKKLGFKKVNSYSGNNNGPKGRPVRINV